MQIVKVKNASKSKKIPSDSPVAALSELLDHASWLRKKGTPREAIAVARYEEMLQRDIQTSEAKAA